MRNIQIRDPKGWINPAIVEYFESLVFHSRAEIYENSDEYSGEITIYLNVLDLIMPLEDIVAVFRETNGLDGILKKKILYQKESLRSVYIFYDSYSSHIFRDQKTITFYFEGEIDYRSKKKDNNRNFYDY